MKRLKKRQKKLDEQGKSGKDVNTIPRKKRKKEDELKFVLSVKKFLKEKDRERRKIRKSKRNLEF